MDVKKLIAVIVMLIIVGIGAVFYFTPLKRVFLTAKNGGSSSNITYKNLSEPLKIAGSDGYKLKKTTINGESVNLIQIPLVTWGGYAALFAANGGTQPSKDSLFYKNGKFVVELIKEENPNVHLQEFASGNYPIIWSTMDMLPLLYNALKQDKRLVPQVFGVFDWSFGGDGIVVRNQIKTSKDLKGKKIVTAGNTPSNFFLLWLLSQSDIKPSEVVIQYVDDAVLAKDAFVNDSKIDACVSWSPFIYEITDPGSKSYVDGAKLLITSKDANQLIADCYLTRIDFMKDHPEIIEAFSKSMMEGYDLLALNQQKVYNDMAAFFKLPGGPNEASAMLGDVHIANFPENMMFFDLDNSISAYKIFYLSQEYYKTVGTLGSDVNYEPESVINKKILDNFKAKGLFTAQTNTIKNSFNKQGSFDIADLESSRIVLAEDLQIYFDAQQINFDLNSGSDKILENKKQLQKIAEQMNVLGTTVVKLIGHLDTSKVEEYKANGMQSYIEASTQAKLLSKKRAEFIKNLLIDRYQCDKDRILTEGKGWDLPLDPNDQSKNRRVEVKFFALE